MIMALLLAALSAPVDGAPLVGQHTREILNLVDIDPDLIDDLLENNVVAETHPDIV